MSPHGAHAGRACNTLKRSPSPVPQRSPPAKRHQLPQPTINASGGGSSSSNDASQSAGSSGPLGPGLPRFPSNPTAPRPRHAFKRYDSSHTTFDFDPEDDHEFSSDEIDWEECLDKNPSPSTPPTLPTSKAKQPFACYDSFHTTFDPEDDHEFSDEDFDWDACNRMVDTIQNSSQVKVSPAGLTSPAGFAPPRPRFPSSGSPPSARLRSRAVRPNLHPAPRPPPPPPPQEEEQFHSPTEYARSKLQASASGAQPAHDRSQSTSASATLSPRNPPGIVGPVVQGPQKCKCYCSCGALKHNQILGYEPDLAMLEAYRRGATIQSTPASLPSTSAPPTAKRSSVVSTSDTSGGASPAPQSHPPATTSAAQTSSDPAPVPPGASTSAQNAPSSPTAQRDPRISSPAAAAEPAAALPRMNNSPPTTGSPRAESKAESKADHSVTDQAQVTAAHPAPGETTKPEPELSAQQQAVLDMVMRRQSLMLTGGAGVGKSVLLRALVKRFREAYTLEGAVAVCATTGIAALHVGGQTLNAWGGIGLGNKPHEQLLASIRKSDKSKSRWLNCQVLVVDEVSMLDAVLFDKLERLARELRQVDKPFGGIQLVLVGDFYQLPPVVTAPTFFGRHDTQSKLKIEYQQLCRTYSSRFVFDAKSWDACIPRTVILRQVFRQADQTFVRMLEETRRGELTPDTITKFQRVSRPLSTEDGIQPTELFSTRNQVNDANMSRLKALAGEVYRYESQDQSFVHSRTQEYPNRFRGNNISTETQIKEYLDKHTVAAPLVELKEGAQVMLIKNLVGGLVNGSRGIVTGFQEFSQSQVAQHQDGRCFFVDPNSPSKPTKVKIRKVRRVPRATARPKEEVGQASTSGSASTSNPVAQSSGPTIINLDSDVESDLRSFDDGPSNVSENIPFLPPGQSSGFEDDDWADEEYESEEEAEEDRPQIEVAIASGKTKVDARRRDPSGSFGPFGRRAPVQDDTAVDYAKPGVKYPLVRFVNGKTLLMVPLKFEVESLVGNAEASRVQVPLILAWSMSIHKAQGQTLDKCRVNLSRVFEKGQAYVALSRATSLEGLQVTGFDPSKVMSDPTVLAWEKKVLAGPDWLAGAERHQARIKAQEVKGKAEAKEQNDGKEEL